MTHLKIFLLLIVCALSVLDGKAQTGIALTDELNGKRIGVIGDSYVRNHKEPFGTHGIISLQRSTVWSILIWKEWE
jgi:hypothetical protein